ncbi:MAG: terpene cyclase/mutase family protein [Planctomycetes bacterium]|nr:terpene cyclase/mutase family protein [Planctomycetota bacterium]
MVAKRPHLSLPAVLVSGAIVCPAAAAEEPREAPPPPARGEITPELKLAVARGLRFLERKQTAEGDFDGRFPVAAGALAGLAVLAGGYSEKAGGEYAEVLRRTTAALLRRQSTAGYFDDTSSFMYGHGFATLYLAELYGTSAYRQAEVRAALEKAIRAIERSQVSSGGWDYHPGSVFGDVARSAGTGDTSITVCQTMALRAARNLGLKVDDGVVARAKAFIERAQNEDGGFRYRLRSLERGSRLDLGSVSAFPRSAAGVCILYSLGEYNTEKIRRGFAYLEKRYELPWTNDFPFYAHYYCAQAMFQAGGRRWSDYFTWIRRKLLEHQKRDGSWPASLRENDVQCTAMALIILQLPNRFLPILER